MMRLELACILDFLGTIGDWRYIRRSFIYGRHRSDEAFAITYRRLAVAEQFQSDAIYDAEVVTKNLQRLAFDDFFLQSVNFPLSGYCYQNPLILVEIRIAVLRFGGPPPRIAGPSRKIMARDWWINSSRPSHRRRFSIGMAG
jgi:hypothetical protein